MNSSGTKFVEWVTIRGALVELTNMYPGTVDSAGLPWYSVTINLLYDHFAPRPTIEFLKKAVYGTKIGDVGVYKVGSVVRVIWDYNHLWNTEISHKLWKVHANDYMIALEAHLSEHKFVYYVKCQRCDSKILSASAADVSDIPGTHYWATVCEKCKSVIKEELLLH
jgi:hypothetical protein